MTFAFSWCTDSSEWDAFVRSSPDGSIFCQTGFLEALSSAPRLATLRSGAELVAGAVIVPDSARTSTRIRCVTAPYRYTLYQGVLRSARLANLPVHRRVPQTLEVVNTLLESLEEQCETINFCLHHNFRDARGFKWFRHDDGGGVKMRVQYTGILRLPDAPELDACLADVRKVRRQECRKAMASGFEVEQTNDVPGFLEVYAQTFARQDITLADDALEQLEAIVRQALDMGFGRLLTCHTSDGEDASMALFLHDDTTAYYHCAANRPELRSSGASSLLMFEALRRSKDELGLDQMDFVGVNSPQRGDFKTSFNAVPTPYYVVSWASPLLGSGG